MLQELKPFHQGVTFDHVQLQFYVNGKLADGCVASNLHTLVYPCFYGENDNH